LPTSSRFLQPLLPTHYECFNYFVQSPQKGYHFIFSGKPTLLQPLFPLKIKRKFSSNVLKVDDLEAGKSEENHRLLK
jgi:hypothetical protein